MPEQPKLIRKRIKSVSSTRKITRTMEMVATAKLKAAQQRVQSSEPYLEQLRALLREIGASGVDVTRWPHFERREGNRTLLLVLTANRGLCGAFNANLIRLGRNVRDEKIARGREVTLHVAGRKGISAFRFQGVEVARGYVTELKDRPEPKDADVFLEALVGPFLRRETDEVVVVYPHWINVGRQPPTALRLLPVAPEEPAKGGAAVPPLFEPSPEAILDALLPLYLRQTIYAALAEAVASEQLARRVAMKLATDNAEEMVNTLTRRYNRARQAQITKEIAEILGGAEALRKK
ncbi:MAG: ATP synthase F1 subunit gamma [Planctomycetota bacterium]